MLMHVYIVTVRSLCSTFQSTPMSEERHVCILFHYDEETFVFHVPEIIFDDKFKCVFDSALNQDKEARWLAHKWCVDVGELPCADSLIDAEEDSAIRQQMEDLNEAIARDEENHQSLYRFHTFTIPRDPCYGFKFKAAKVYVLWSILDDKE